MRKDQRRTVYPFNDIGHREGLAGAGGTFQDLFTSAFLKTSDQFVDRLRLIAGRPEIRHQFESVSH